MNMHKIREVKKLRESTVEKYLVKKIKSAGGLALKFTSPGMAGVPDRLIVIKGTMFFVEVKAPNEKPRVQQQLRFNQLRSHGAVVVVLDTKESVDRLIENIELKEW